MRQKDPKTGKPYKRSKPINWAAVKAMIAHRRQQKRDFNALPLVEQIRVIVREEMAYAEAQRRAAAARQSQYLPVTHIWHEEQNRPRGPLW